MGILYNANNGRFYTAKNDEGQVAVIDWHGQELLPFSNYSEYDLFTSNGGTLLLARNKDTAWWRLTGSTNKVIHPSDEC